MKLKKILIITTDYPPPMGGVQVFTFELEQELINSGHVVKVLNFDGRNTSTYKYLSLRDFFYCPATRNTHFALSKILNPFNFFNNHGGYRDFVYKNMIYRVSKKTINDFEPELIHVMKNELYSAVFDTDVPYIVSCHSSSVDLYDAPHIRHSLEHAKKIHCVSEFTKKLVLNIVPKVSHKIAVIYNFVDLSKYKNIPIEKKNRIITVSRLSKGKNINTLIKAYSILPKELQQNYEYLVVGGGGELISLMKLAKELQLSNVRFTGEITDEGEKIKLLAQSNLFLLCPSEPETFGIVFIEAQALGIPVICSTLGGIPEAVGKGGLYVNNERNPQEVANAISLLLADSTLYSGIQKEIALRIGQFDKKIWFRKILLLYAGVIQN